MKRKGDKNITWIQRLQIETLYKAKRSVIEIAKLLELDRSTIYRELHRGEFEYTKQKKSFWYETKYKRVKSYSATMAQERYNNISSARGRPIKLANDYEYIDYITNRVKNDKLSVCAVLGEIDYLGLQFKTHVSKQTMYSYIEKGYIPYLKLTKHKRSYKKVKAKRAPRGTSIEKRPEEISNRNTFGHWEMDLVVGSSKTALLVLTERLTRKEIIFKIKNKSTISIITCLNTLERRYKDCFHKLFKSITVDNGSEFADFRGMEKSIFGEYKRVSIYYCHPYTSCERGSNERINKDIRRLIPKGSDISKYTHVFIQKVEDWLNNYPRKIFNYATPNDMFNKQMRLIL